MGNRGNNLMDRYKSLVERGLDDDAGADLAEAIATYEQAVRLSRGDLSARSGNLSNLGTALRARYTRSWNQIDLDTAIDRHRQAVQPTEDFPDRHKWLNNLANCLQDRYFVNGSLEDLDEAIKCHKEALSALYFQGWLQVERFGSCAHAAECATHLRSLGMCLWDRHLVLGRDADRDQAVQAFARALHAETGPLASQPSDDLLKAVNLSIDLWGDVLESPLAPAPVSQAFHKVAARGAMLYCKYLQSEGEGDLDEAIVSFSQAVDLVPLGSASWAILKRYLGRTLRDRHALVGNPRDQHAAIDAYRQSCERRPGELHASAPTALAAAREWGNWAAERASWREATDALDYGLDAAEQLSRTQITRSDKETWLRWARGLPTEAAYAAAQDGQSERAVEALERGRAVVFAEVLERDRVVLERLPAELRREYGVAVQRIRVAERSFFITERRRAREAFDQAVGRIRQAPGYERFLERRSAERVLEDVRAAADQPIVYLAAARRGGVALIVRPRRTPAEAGPGPKIEALSLPALTEEAVGRLVIAMRATHARRREASGAWRGTVDAVTHWLGTAVVDPVLIALGPAAAARLVPAGLVSLLPIHAAWIEDPDDATRRRYAVDQVDLSYAPTGLALRRARDIAARVGADTLLAVADPQPSRPLPLAVSEAKTAASWFAHPVIRCGQQADRATVARDMQEHLVLHFACHGIARLDFPLDSALLLYDEPLTLRDILDVQLADQPDGGGARLALLSACETQLPGTELPDEVVSLPTGFLQAGFAGVISTQWAVSELASAILMTRFYRLWKAERASPASALCKAQTWLRDKTNHELSDYLHPETGDCGVPKEVARTLWRAVLCWDSERDLVADWAAFTYVGV